MKINVSNPFNSYFEPSRKPVKLPGLGLHALFAGDDRKVAKEIQSNIKRSIKIVKEMDSICSNAARGKANASGLKKIKSLTEEFNGLQVGIKGNKVTDDNPKLKKAIEEMRTKYASIVAPLISKTGASPLSDVHKIYEALVDTRKIVEKKRKAFDSLQLSDIAKRFKEISKLVEKYPEFELQQKKLAVIVKIIMDRKNTRHQKTYEKGRAFIAKLHGEGVNDREKEKVIKYLRYAVANSVATGSELSAEEKSALSLLRKSDEKLKEIAKKLYSGHQSLTAPSKPPLTVKWREESKDFDDDLSELYFDESEESEGSDDDLPMVDVDESVAEEWLNEPPRADDGGEGQLSGPPSVSGYQSLPYNPESPPPKPLRPRKDASLDSSLATFRGSNRGEYEDVSQELGKVDHEALPSDLRDEDDDQGKTR